MKIEELINMLSGTDFASKMDALSYVIEHKNNFNQTSFLPLLPHIHPLLNDQNIGIRSIAAFALSKVGNHTSIPFLNKSWFDAHIKEDEKKEKEKRDHLLNRQILIAIADIDKIELALPILRNFKEWSHQDKALAAECFGTNLIDLLNYEKDLETREAVIKYLMREGYDPAHALSSLPKET